jgi:hypothetical protein
MSLVWAAPARFFSKVSKCLEEGFIGTTGRYTGGSCKSLNWKAEMAF